MQYDVETPKAYLEQLEEDWRKSHLLRVRDLLLEAAPEFVERIKYKMLAYGSDTEELFQLNAQRGYVSLYVGNIETVDPDRRLLAAYSLGKGCIRFRKASELDDPSLRTFIAKAVSMWRDGNPIDC